MFTHELFDADRATKHLDEITTLVKTKDIDLSDYKDAIEASGVTLTKKEIIFAIAGVEDEQDADTWAAIFASRAGEEDEDEVDTTETVVVDKHTSLTMERSAKSFAKHLEGAFMDQSFDIQEADEKSKRGIAIMAWDRLNGAKPWSKEVWNSIPRLDITQKEAKEKKLNVLLSRWTTKENNRPKVKDWFEIAITNTTRGAELSLYLEDLNIANSDAVKTGRQVELAKMSKTDRSNEISTTEKRLAGLVNRLKRMVKLVRLIDDINESPANKKNMVVAGLIPKVDNEGNETGLTTTVECLFLQKQTADGKRIIDTESYIPNTFLRLDPVEAAEKVKDGTTAFWDALKATKDRGAGSGVTGFKEITSPEKFMGAMNVVQNYLDDEGGANILSFTKAFGKLESDDEKKEVAETLETNYMKLGAFFNIVKPTLERIRDAEHEAAVAENKAKAGGLRKTG